MKKSNNTIKSPNKHPIIAIVGPTGTGKSELAVKIARKINGEIISADSRQIYRDLNIGSAKVKGRWKKDKKSGLSFFVYKNIPHHLLDFLPLEKTYSAGEFQKTAEKIIADMRKRGKNPVIAGGTGFWTDSLIFGYKLPDVPPNRKLRRKLVKKKPAELFKILKRLDAARAANIEKENPRRLLRAIEIVAALGKVPKLTRRKKYETLWLGIYPEKNKLSDLIKKRADKMIKKGLIAETKKLIRKTTRQKIKELGFEYQTSLDYLEGKLTRKEFTDELAKKTIAYAKRQMRWFKRNKDIKWFSDAKTAFRHFTDSVLFRSKKRDQKIS